MRPIIFAFFLALIPTLVAAQCYTALRDDGKALLKAKKYDEAIAQFQRAKNCRTDKPANGDAEMDRLIADARKRKSPTKSTAKKTLAKPKTPPARQAFEPEMVLVEGGTFTMGCENNARDGDCYDDERPAHPVRVRSYYLATTEVTQAQWRAIMGSDPPELYFKGCDQCPVESVSWNEVQEFIKKLNAKTGKRYRLPTEAEWEYAARGGWETMGYQYAGSNNLDEVGWHDGNSSATTSPVGKKKANELGLYDMCGNVWEWCSDWYGAYIPSKQTNPTGPDSGDNRVSRGGSWSYAHRYCRIAARRSDKPTGRFGGVGFRLALQ